MAARCPIDLSQITSEREAFLMLCQLIEQEVPYRELQAIAAKLLESVEISSSTVYHSAVAGLISQ